MTLSYKARRRWALVILLVGMPLYIVAAVNLIDLFDRPSVPVELMVYLGLGFLWILPFRAVFRGIGQPDPDATRPDTEKPETEKPETEKPETEKPETEKPETEKTDRPGPSV